MTKNSAATPPDHTAPQGKATAGKTEESSQNQQDMLADAGLDQVAEDSEQLLKNQFKIDKWLAEQQRVATPQQDW
jgi:hypothetical protein